jgi:predicted TIM-barrel fold metal-dependent hydrolase
MVATPAKFIDSDVHPLVDAPLKTGLPGSGFFAGIREYLSRDEQAHFDLRKQLPYPRYEIPFGNFSQDAAPPNGGPPGSSAKFAIEQHLDARGVVAGILSSLEHAYLTALPNPRDTVVLSSALNNYLVDHWLGADRRFKLAIGVTPKDPLAAAAEIRRLADNEQVVAVYLPTMNILFGNHYFHPIYEAAQEYGLPIFSHVGAGEGDFSGAAPMPGGQPSHFAERRSTFATVAQANVSSLVFEGTFETFPRLKFAFVEWGFAWAPPLMWAMDARWRGLRPDTPWVKRPPSEYVLDHIRWTTQPLDEPESQDHLRAVLDMIHADRTILFSTDYPHWDNEFPDRVLRGLTPELQQRILVDNAVETFPRLGADVTAALAADATTQAAPAGASRHD